MLANSLGNRLTQAEIQRHQHKRTQAVGWHCQDLLQKHYIKKKKRERGKNPTQTKRYLDFKKTSPDKEAAFFFAASNSSRYRACKPDKSMLAISNSLAHAAVTLATMQRLPVASYQAVREAIQPGQELLC